MRTSIFRIELALDGKVDFLKKTDPWRSTKSNRSKSSPSTEKPDPAKAAGQLMSFLRAQQKPRG